MEGSDKLDSTARYSLDNIDELPVDSGEEVDAPTQQEPALYTFPQYAPYSFDPPDQNTLESPHSSSSQSVPVHAPSTTKGRGRSREGSGQGKPKLSTIILNPLGRPLSDIYKSIESPHYNTDSEESKDVTEVTDKGVKQKIIEQRAEQAPPQEAAGDQDAPHTIVETAEENNFSAAIAEQHRQSQRNEHITSL